MSLEIGKTKWAVWVLVFVLMFSRSIFGQGLGAASALTGHVVDQTGAAIPGAKLGLLEINQGATYSTVSNSVGYYVFPHLPHGVYKLTVTYSGMNTSIITSIDLHVSQTANVDVTMRPGKVLQTVEVNASVLRLQTQTSSTGQTLSSTTIADLPTQTRSPYSLITLAAGVTSSFVNGGPGYFYTQGAGSTGGIVDWSREDFSAVGAPEASALVMVDGADVKQDHTEGMGTPSVVPSPDFTQEMKYQSTNYDPEYGWGMGVVNVVTKSGTNALHGTAFEYNQNSAFGAADFFSNAQGLPTPYINRNDAGVDLGGPVYIPKIYDGRNHAWFFFDYERLQQATPLQVATRVPTAAELNGDFNNEYALTGQQITLYNPFNLTTTSTGQTDRVAFPNNTIPSSMINPFAAKLFTYFPAPNVPGGVLAPGGLPSETDNFNKVFTPNYHFGRIDAKGDVQVSPKQHLMARVSINPDVLTTPDVYGPGNPANPAEGQFYYYTNEVLSHTWTISPTFMLTQLVSYARQSFHFPEAGYGYDPTQLGGPFASGAITNFSKQWNEGPSFPEMSFGGYDSMGALYSAGENHIGEYELDMVKEKGPQELKWGFQGEIVTNGAGPDGSLGWTGSYSWTGSWTCGPNPLLCSAYSGNSIADLEEGLVGSGELGTVPEDYPSERRYGLYFSDNWRVTPRLTLNLGVRDDFDVTGYERYNHEGALDLGMPSPIGFEIGPDTNGETLDQYLGRTLMGVIEYAGTATDMGRSRLGETDLTDIAPRLGLAYRIGQNWVVRGGWARIYNDSYAGGEVAIGTGLYGETPYSGLTEVVPTVDGIHPIIDLNNPAESNFFPSGLNVPTGTADLTTGVGYATSASPLINRVPYSNQWNIGIERALAGKALLKISYVGTQAEHLGCWPGQCGDPIPISVAHQYGDNLYQTVPNPFYGIVTGAGSPLNTPTIEEGALLVAYPQYPGTQPAAFLNSNAVWPTFQQGYPFHSFWNGMLVSFEKQFSSGSDILISYTVSKALGDVGEAFEAGSYGYQNLTNLNQEYSLETADVPQRLVVSHVYQLPFGHGQHFGATWNRAADAVLGGWRASGVLTLQAGFPLAITDTPDNSGVGGGAIERPNLVSTPQLTSGNLGQRLLQWVNPDAFQQPAPFTFGDAPRILNVREDPLYDYDFSLAKHFALTERLGLQIRWDNFNLFNRPYFNVPNMVFGSTSFGLVSSTVGPPRFMQFGFRLSW
jgi:hypothetical protein